MEVGVGSGDLLRLFPREALDALVETGARPTGGAAVDAWRLRDRRPVLGVDTDDRLIPHEVPAWIGAGIDGATRLADATDGPTESAVHPRWSPGGELVFVSDRTDWWNLYAVRDGAVSPLWPEAAEFATPQWVFGDQPYVVLDSSRLLVSRVSEGVTSLHLLDRASQTLRHIDWFEVTQVRGQAKDGSVEHFQVGLKIGFRLEDDGPVG